MRWHLGMLPTAVEVYEAPNGNASGYTHGDGQFYGASVLNPYTAGGYAAENKRRKMSKLDRFIHYGMWLDAFKSTPEKFAGSDMEFLAKRGRNVFEESFEYAHSVVNKNWNKVLQIAGLLEKDKTIEEAEMERIFAEWGSSDGGAK